LNREEDLINPKVHNERWTNPTGSLSRGYWQKYNVSIARSNGKADLGIDVITRV